MIRLIAIAIFAVIAYMLIRNKTSEKIQKWVAIVLSSILFLYFAAVVIAELAR
ncbi:MAG: hypothetical protein ACK5NC_07965 [Vibrio sp.]